MKGLIKRTADLNTPADYFAGIGGAPWCWPLNLIAFSRKTRRDLQRRTFESRLHTRYVLVTNLGTSGTLNLDSTPYRLRPGECHLIFPHQLHTFHDVDSEAILWLFVTFELPDETPLRALRQTTLVIDDLTRRMFEEFLDAYRSRGTAIGPHRLQSILSAILLRLVQSAEGAGTRSLAKRGSDEQLLEAIHSHHARHLPEALSINQLASLMKLSESRLRARFRETFGLSLGTYLRNLRLQEALSMMRHSGANLTEIALSCAFGSSSAFSRAFKSWAGTAPRSFRKSVAEPRQQEPHAGPKRAKTKARITRGYPKTST